MKNISACAHTSVYMQVRWLGPRRDKQTADVPGMPWYLVITPQRDGSREITEVIEMYDTAAWYSSDVTQLLPEFTKKKTCTMHRNIYFLQYLCKTNILMESPPVAMLCFLSNTVFLSYQIVHTFYDTKPWQNHGIRPIQSKTLQRMNGGHREANHPAYDSGWPQATAPRRGLLKRRLHTEMEQSTDDNVAFERHAVGIVARLFPT